MTILVTTMGENPFFKIVDADYIEPIGGKCLALPGGTVLKPCLTIGSTNTGFYEVAANQIGISIGGVSRFLIFTDALQSTSTSGFLLRRLAATSTAPGFSFLGDDNTGIGRAAADQLSLIAGGVEGLRLTEASTLIEADFKKVRITNLGGIAVKLTNKTGSASVVGELVKADTANDEAVILTGADDVECLGVFYESGISDGSEAWIVVSGIANVRLKDSTAATRGNWVGTHDTAGRADATGASPPVAPGHFQEIGHCIETKTGGTGVVAKCILHFL